MPIYIFKCPECDYENDYFLSMNDFQSAQIICPNCNINMKNVFGTTILDFKGGGWAKDSYNKPKIVEGTDK